MISAAPVVFVVDDEEPVRLSLRALLRAEGFAVESFASGAELLAAMDRRTPDCVLTDFHMPGMDGRDVIAELERRHKKLPVVLMTGRDDPGQLALNDRVRVISKPFDANVLLPLLRDLIDDRRGG
ncbi:MAG: response regulator transcription factor [Steroidobacteraceae bacterium]